MIRKVSSQGIKTSKTWGEASLAFKEVTKNKLEKILDYPNLIL